MGADLLHLAEEVAGEQYGDPPLGEASDELAHLVHLLWVQAVGGLIEDEQLRPAEERLGDAEALAHPVRVGPHRAVDRIAELGHGEGLLHVGLREGLPPGPPVEAQVVDAGQVRHEPRPLHQGADPGEHRVPGAHRLAEDRSGAGRRVDEPEQHADRRGLARAVGTEEAEYLARPDREGEVVHGDEAAPEPLAQAGDRDRVGAGRSHDGTDRHGG